MITTPSDSSDVVFVVPPGVISLGEALAPVAKYLRPVLVSKVTPTGPDFMIFDDLSHHMDMPGHVPFVVTVG
jgi:hypothetical protein